VSDDRPRQPKAIPFSDIDLNRWKEYDDLHTDSLWILGARDRTGPHAGDYWGNFVPQIPNQVLRRFTRQGEVVVDLFNGMGTTLIECRHLGRHGIGVELSGDVAERANERIALAENPHAITTTVLTGDARTEETVAAVRSELEALGTQHAQCVLLHPPYHNIIRFSDSPDDLSNMPSVEAFLVEFARVVDHAYALLAERRFLALVIGDMYQRATCIPLGFRCMQVCIDRGLTLKSINVKDIQGNERGKGKSENLWRYRALQLGFSVFKHEYVMLFQKPKVRRKHDAPSRSVADSSPSLPPGDVHDGDDVGPDVVGGDDSVFVVSTR